MGRKKKLPPNPPHALAYQIIDDTLRESIPDRAQRSTAANDLVNALPAIVEAMTSSSGRPPRYPSELLRARYTALVRRPSKPHYPDGGELFRRYQSEGTRPDTKSKWRADTLEWLRGWWVRQQESELHPPNVRFPDDEIRERLGSNARGTGGSLHALARFLICERFEISEDRLRSILYR